MKRAGHRVPIVDVHAGRPFGGERHAHGVGARSRGVLGDGEIDALVFDMRHDAELDRRPLGRLTRDGEPAFVIGKDRGDDGAPNVEIDLHPAGRPRGLESRRSMGRR